MLLTRAVEVGPGGVDRFLECARTLSVAVVFTRWGSCFEFVLDWFIGDVVPRLEEPLLLATVASSKLVPTFLRADAIGLLVGSRRITNKKPCLASGNQRLRKYLSTRTIRRFFHVNSSSDLKIPEHLRKHKFIAVGTTNTRRVIVKLRNQME